MDGPKPSSEMVAYQAIGKLGAVQFRTPKTERLETGWSNEPVLVGRYGTASTG